MILHVTTADVRTNRTVGFQLPTDCLVIPAIKPRNIWRSVTDALKVWWSGLQTGSSVRWSLFNLYTKNVKRLTQAYRDKCGGRGFVWFCLHTSQNMKILGCPKRHEYCTKFTQMIYFLYGCAVISMQIVVSYWILQRKSMQNNQSWGCSLMCYLPKSQIHFL